MGQRLVMVLAVAAVDELAIATCRRLGLSVAATGPQPTGQSDVLMLVACFIS